MNLAWCFRRVSSSLRLCAVLLALLTATGSAEAQDPARTGTVAFSDGTTLAGKITLTPGSELKLHVGNQLRTFALERVREIRLAPEKESLEQKYRFIEAGKAIKETQGQPYPVRSLKTTIILADGEALSGHLYTTVLYVEADEHAQKVILPAKQQGQEGQSLAALVYPAKISFSEVATPAEATIRLKLKVSGLSARSEVAALTRGPLLRLEAKALGTAGEYQVPSPLGRELFLAVKTGQHIRVGWPKASDEKLAELVRAALPAAEDFFDERQVLRVFSDEPNAELYSLLLVSRQGKTTLAETRSQPWRLEIYRWKVEPDTHRLMLAGKGYLFRGIGAKNEAVPTVELSDKLWRVRKLENGTEWVVGGE